MKKKIMYLFCLLTGIRRSKTRRMAESFVNAQHLLTGGALFTRLLPYIQERAFTCYSTLPNFIVKLEAVEDQPIGCYEGEQHFSLEGTTVKEARMALSNALMEAIRQLALVYPSKPRVNLTFRIPGKRFQSDNILLRAPGCDQEMMDSLNFAIMDEMTDSLLKNPVTHFTIYIKMHE